MVKNSRKTVKIAKMTMVHQWSFLLFWLQSSHVYQDCTNSVPIIKNMSKNSQKTVKTAKITILYQSSHVYTESTEYTKSAFASASASAECTKPKIWVLAVTSPIPAFFPRTHLQTRISLTDFVSQWVYAVFMYYLPCQAEQVDNAGIACFAESWRCDATQRSTYRSNNSHTRIWACALASALRHD